MSLTEQLRDVVPPALLRQWRRRRGVSMRFIPQSGGWPAAVRHSTGYDAKTILERVTRATQEVVAGRALFERDGVLFHEPDYPFAMLATLLGAALRNAGTLDVLDFGGSLGSKYRQCLPMLQAVQHLRWCVVEQPAFVQVGRQRFSDASLTFAESMSALPFERPPNVALASSVLQYLPNPYGVLDDLHASGAEQLVIDRTPMSGCVNDVACVQRVPSFIYEGSYPCWVLSRDMLVAHLTRHWTIECEFPGPEVEQITDGGLRFHFRGLILRRKPI
jgi:putative methyltransferase (TIGR04325 family)